MLRLQMGMIQFSWSERGLSFKALAQMLDRVESNYEKNLDGSERAYVRSLPKLKGAEQVPVSIRL